jgi:hypothetical protein
LICFFLGLYIVTTFWVTPFSFLYCKHCFTPSLFLLLLLWHFYGLITDLSLFVFFFVTKDWWHSCWNYMFFCFFDWLVNKCFFS